MARDSSGTHTLPAGNPVVSGTAISSTVQNNTLNDISAEITDSLSRTGKGPMSAPLELTNGTVATPSLSFDSDPDTGLYRKGANNLALVAGGAEVADIQAAGMDVTGALTVSTTLAVTGATTLTGAATLTGGIPAGLVVTQSTANTAAVTATGNGSGGGGVFTGGLTGSGVSGIGGATSGTGGSFVGGPNSIGVFGNGTGTGAGVKAQGGATGPDIELAGSAPASTAAFSNAIVKTSVIKVHGSIDFNVSTATVSGGFNIASASIQSASVVRITFATAFANTSYTWSAIVESGSGDFSTPCIPYVSSKTTGYLELRFRTLGDALVSSINTTGSFQLSFFASGAQ